MRKLIILTAAALLVFSCGSKQKSAPDFLYGSKLYSQFQMYYLKGDAKLADYNFYKSEAQFMKVDSVCNLSRIFIGRFVIQETGEDTASLEVAKKYAEAGRCSEENNIIAYLENKDFDKDKLTEPYSTINKLSLKEMASADVNSYFDDVTKTRLLRKASINYIMQNPALSEEIAQKAIAIDKLNGWSLNILRDLIIIKEARLKQNKEVKDIETRIQLIKTQLIKK